MYTCDIPITIWILYDIDNVIDKCYFVDPF